MARDEYDSVYLLKAQHMYFQYPDFEASQRIKKGAGFPIAERGSVRWEVVLQNFLNENIS